MDELTYALMQSAALRKPGRAKTNLMANSVMSKPSEPEPYIGHPSQVEPGLEAVSPEDFIPNPKSAAAAVAALAKGGAGLGMVGSLAKGSGGYRLPLAGQVKRMLKRDLTPEEIQRMARAEEQGFNVAGWHYGDFTNDLPNSFPSTGEKAAYHLDLTPSGGQAFSRKVTKQLGTGDGDPLTGNEQIRLVIAKLLNPELKSDEAINNMARNEKASMVNKGTTGAIYPNLMEISPGITKKSSSDPYDLLLTGGPIEHFAYEHNNLGGTVFNPSAAIFDPKDVRLFEAAFDPKNINKSKFMGSATVPAMLGAAGLGALSLPIIEELRNK